MKYQERFEELDADEELTDDAMFEVLVAEFPRKGRETVMNDIRTRRQTHYQWKGTQPIHS